MSKQEIVIDPIIRNLIPALSDAEFEQLRENIKADGKIKEAVEIWRDPDESDASIRKIVDGHNRHAISELEGIGYRTVELELTNLRDVKIYVVKKQLGRRNLTDYSRTVAALQLKEYISEQANENQRRAGGNKNAKPLKTDTDNTNFPSEKSGKSACADICASAPRKPDTRAAIAEMAGVSHDTVGKVEKIREDGATAIQKMAASGDVSISAAATVAAALPKDEQRKIAAQGPDAVKEKAAEIREEKKTPAKRERKKPALAEKIEPEEAEQVFDGLGEVVTDKELIVVFQNAAKFDHILNLLNQVSKGISELTGNENDMDGISGGEELAEHRQKLRNDYVNLRTAVKFAKPYATCPYAHVKGQKCNACHGLGWVVKDTYTRAPEELKSGKGAA